MSKLRNFIIIFLILSFLILLIVSKIDIGYFPIWIDFEAILLIVLIMIILVLVFFIQ